MLARIYIMCKNMSKYKRYILKQQLLFEAEIKKIKKVQTLFE